MIFISLFHGVRIDIYLAVRRRPSKSQDYPGHDDGPTTPHKTDFFSPSSHHSSFNRSNSNESWRSRNNFQDADNGDYRKDRWRKIRAGFES